MNRCITHMYGLSGESRAGPKPVHSGFSKDKNKWFGFLSCKGLGLGSKCWCRGLGFERCELSKKIKNKKRWAALISLPSYGARRKGEEWGLDAISKRSRSKTVHYNSPMTFDRWHLNVVRQVLLSWIWTCFSKLLGSSMRLSNWRQTLLWCLFLLFDFYLNYYYFFICQVIFGRRGKHLYGKI